MIQFWTYFEGKPDDRTNEIISKGGSKIEF